MKHLLLCSSFSRFSFSYSGSFVCVLVSQSCPTLCNPVDCSAPGSTVHGIFQAGILSGFAFPSPGNLPNPGTELGSPALQVDFSPDGLPGKLFRVFCSTI